MTRAARLAPAVLACIFFLPLHAELARNKPFHLDEGYEWSITCGESTIDIVRRGALGQCSPSPAYYVLERWFARAIEIRDEGILLTYRLPSLVSSAALVLLLGGWLAARLGPLPAAAALGALLSQPLFHHYATESRPYGMALALLAVVLLLLSEATARGAPPRGAWIAAAAVACLGSSLVLLTGAAQAVTACAAFLLLLRARGEGLRSRRAAVVAALLVACAVCAAYYRARSGCVAAYDPGPLSVRGLQGRLLVERVVALIWSDNLWANLLVIAGVVAVVRAWRRRASGDSEDAFALGLGVQALAQLALTGPLVAQVVASNYFFLPRLFLHLALCRAILVALGVWLVLRALSRWWSALTVARVVSALGCTVALAVAHLLLRQEVDDRRRAAPWLRPPAAACLPWVAPLRLVLTGSPPLEFGPNLFVEAASEARRCGFETVDPPAYLVASADGAREIRRQPPADGALMRQCGLDVSVWPTVGR